MLDLPNDALLSLQLLGENLRIARRRRQWTQIDFATKMGVHIDTYRSMESGSPNVSMGVYLQALSILGMHGNLDSLADPNLDKHGIVLEREDAGKRVRPKTDRPGMNF